MTVRISTLVENTVAGGNVYGEWGLSMLVETDDFTVLADTGATSAAARNAQTLGVSLSAVEAVFFSHGHFDHTGGLLHLLNLVRKPVQVLAHPAVWDRKYADSPDLKVCEYNRDSVYEYIGIPYARELAETYGARFVLGEDPVWLSDTVVTSGEVPMRTDYETVDPILYVWKDGEYRPDTVPDDQSIFVKTDKGLVAILGCAHRGIINHLWRGQQLTGVDTVYAVVGGTHLIAADDKRIETTIRELKRLNVQVVAASHCTGLHAACALEHAFGDAFRFNNAGTRITI